MDRLTDATYNALTHSFTGLRSSHYPGFLEVLFGWPKSVLNLATLDSHFPENIAIIIPPST